MIFPRRPRKRRPIINIWLITVGEPLPIDSRNARLLRTGIFAEVLADLGHSVTWWSSTFDHTAKKLRAESDQNFELRDNYQLRLLHGKPYQKNISLQRFINHRNLATRFRIQTRQIDQLPDIIFCSFPTIELAHEALLFGKRHGIPVIFDVRDMWPDIFVNLAPKVARPFVRIGLSNLFRTTRKCFAGAFAITGHAPDFVDWGLEYAGRKKTKWDRDFPFGYHDRTPEQDALGIANQFWDQLGVTSQSEVPTICFFGALGKQFVMEPVIEAVRRINKDTPIKLVVCGDGGRLPDYRRSTEKDGNILFPGWVEGPQIWSLMRRSTIAVAPYQDSADFRASIPNKAIEYMSAGLPILSSLGGGELNQLLEERQCGQSYAGNSQVLESQIRNLLDSPDKLNKMSSNARQLFEERFRAETVYGELAEYLQDAILQYQDQTVSKALAPT